MPNAKVTSRHYQAKKPPSEVCTHGYDDPNACVECTDIAILSNPTARAAYRQACIARGVAQGLAASEDVMKLLARIEAGLPYVTTTIDPRGGNVLPAQHNKDWVEVHRGRAFSSTSILKRILKDTEALKAKLTR